MPKTNQSVLKEIDQETLEEIKGNWEYEGCVKPEHIEWMIEKIEEEIIND